MPRSPRGHEASDSPDVSATSSPRGEIARAKMDRGRRSSMNLGLPEKAVPSFGLGKNLLKIDMSLLHDEPLGGALDGTPKSTQSTGIPAKAQLLDGRAMRRASTMSPSGKGPAFSKRGQQPSRRTSIIGVIDRSRVPSPSSGGSGDEIDNFPQRARSVGSNRSGRDFFASSNSNIQDASPTTHTPVNAQMYVPRMFEENKVTRRRSSIADNSIMAAMKVAREAGLKMDGSESMGISEKPRKRSMLFNLVTTGHRAGAKGELGSTVEEVEEKKAGMTASGKVMMEARNRRKGSLLAFLEKNKGEEQTDIPSTPSTTAVSVAMPKLKIPPAADAFKSLPRNSSEFSREKKSSRSNDSSPRSDAYSEISSDGSEDSAQEARERRRKRLSETKADEDSDESRGRGGSGEGKGTTPLSLKQRFRSKKSQDGERQSTVKFQGKSRGFDNHNKDYEGDDKNIDEGEEEESGGEEYNEMVIDDVSSADEEYDEERKKHRRVYTDINHWKFTRRKLRHGDKSRMSHTIRLDEFNVRRALDPETWNSIIYMEGCVVDTEKGEAYFALVVCEDRLIFLPLSATKKTKMIIREFSQGLLAGGGYIMMIPAYDIVSMRYVRGADDAASFWKNNRHMTSRSIHIELQLSSQFDPIDPHSDSCESYFHIYTYEINSQIMYHISTMWINVATKLKTDVSIAKEESDLTSSTDYIKEIVAALMDEQVGIGDQVALLDNISEEVLNDMTLKKLFFQHAELNHYLIRVLKNFKQECGKLTAKTTDCKRLVVSQLRRLASTFKLIYAALFNSQTIEERWHNFQADFTENLEVLVADYGTWLQKFEVESGFKTNMLNISDKKKLEKLREHRKSMGKPTSKKKGRLAAKSFAVITGIDQAIMGRDEEDDGTSVRSEGSIAAASFEKLDVSALIEDESVDPFGDNENDDKLSPIYAKKKPPKRNMRQRKTTNMGGMANSQQQHELYHYLSESIYDYQTMVLVEFHTLVSHYNNNTITRQGRYRHEGHESIAAQIKYILSEEQIYTFVENIFQRMIALMDEIKSSGDEENAFVHTHTILDKIERMNFERPLENATPRLYTAINETNNECRVDKIYQSSRINIYYISRLLYCLINDNMVFREIAKDVGEEVSLSRHSAPVSEL